MRTMESLSGNKLKLKSMEDYEVIAKELWADFDEILNINALCPNISIHNKVVATKKMALVTVQLILMELQEICKSENTIQRSNELDFKFKFWKEVNNEMLKL